MMSYLVNFADSKDKLKHDESYFINTPFKQKFVVYSKGDEKFTSVF